MSVLICLSMLFYSCSNQSSQTVNSEVSIASIEVSDVSISVSENPNNGQLLGAIAAIAGDDRSLSYELTSQSVDGAMVIDSLTGMLSVADSSVFDYNTNQHIAAEVTVKTSEDTKVAHVTVHVLHIEIREPLIFVIKLPHHSLDYALSGLKTIVDPKTKEEETLRYNFNVDWGDGSISHIENIESPDLTHSYASEGPFKVKISGVVPHLVTGRSSAVQSIEQWGDIKWVSLENAFANNRNLVINAKDAPDLSQAISTRHMFGNCTKFNSGNLNGWDLKYVIDVSAMFSSAILFN